MYTATNGGTTKAYPIFELKQTGATSVVLQMIRNETTGHTLYFNNYQLLDSEVIIIDLTPGKKSVKSKSGAKSSTANRNILLPNSDLAEFCLLPGANVISVYAVVTGTPTVSAQAFWKIPHWGIDGGAR